MYERVATLLVDALYLYNTRCSRHFGLLQSETSPLLAVGTGVGLLTVITLHVAAARREVKVDSKKLGPVADGFVYACAVSGIPEKCATVVSVNGERVAIFKYDGKISAISNVCRHQNGHRVKAKSSMAM